MKKIVKLGAVAACFVAASVFISCSQPTGSGGDDSGIDVKTASDYYTNLIGTDITKSCPDLVVYDASGNATTISSTSLKSSASVRSARAASNDLGWHPLKKDITTFYPQDEVLAIGSYIGGAWIRKFEDNSSDYSDSAVATGDDSAWESTATIWKMAAGGDFDNDGIDEVFIAYYDSSSKTCKYRVYENDAVSSLQNIDITMPDNYIYYCYRKYMYAGDIDGDGKDEVVLYARRSSDTESKLYVIDIDGTAATVTAKMSLPSVKALAVGDMDGNGTDEIIAATESAVSIYNVSGSSIVATLSGHTWFSGTTAPQDCSVAAGDFDGDGADEIVVFPLWDLEDSAPSSDDQKAVTFNGLSMTRTTATIKNTVSDATGVSQYESDYYFSVPVTGDFDSDGKDDIFFGQNMTLDPLGNCTQKAILSGYTVAKMAFAGDVNGDAKKDIIVVASDDKIQSWGLDSAGNATEYKEYYTSAGSDKPYCAFVAANIDNDSPRVQYTGHELKYSTPVVVAALAAAPYYSDLVGQYNYDPSGWVTTFGKSKTTTSGNSNAVGVSVGGIVGFTFKAFGYSIESEVSVKGSFRKEWSNEHSYTESVTYSGTAADDRVIFTAIPVDTFSYTVVSDGDDKGKVLTIKIPRAYSTYSQPVTYYNSHNGDAPDVTCFTHTAGTPSTYLTNEKAVADAATRDASYISSASTAVVGYDGSNPLAGGETNAIEIDVDSTHGYTISAGAEVEATFKTKICHVVAGLSVGLEYEHTWSSSTTNGTAFSGTVGNLPNEWLDKNASAGYTEGLYVFKQDASYQYNKDDGSTYTKDEPFWVVTYYVN